MKTISLFFITGLLSLIAQASPAPFLVVIDPGHGGADHGAVIRAGKKVYREKELTLELGHALARQLRARNIQAILTRRSDQELQLDERTAIANRVGAQVFVSLHLNSVAKKRRSSLSAQGVETYILNHATDDTSKRLAHFENSVLKGSVAETNETGDVSLIVKDLLLTANRDKSKELACDVQHQLRKVARNGKNRGVKQALFYVLLGADMPSILVEAGFLNSPKDRRRVSTKRGRQRLANAIAQAIEKFRSIPPAGRPGHRSLAKCKIL